MCTKAVQPKTFGGKFGVSGEDKLWFNVSSGVWKSKLRDGIRFIIYDAVVSDSPSNEGAYWLQIVWLEPFPGDVCFSFLQPHSVGGNKGM